MNTNSSELIDKIEDMNNPFRDYETDSLLDEDVVGLFVNLTDDLGSLDIPQNVFITGPRGSGKSMLLKMMSVGCQMRHTHKTLHELEFLGFYMPLDSVESPFSEMHKDNERLDNQREKYILNEHLLCSYIAVCVLKEISKALTKTGQDGCSEAYLRKLQGWAEKKIKLPLIENNLDESINFKMEQPITCTTDFFFEYCANYLQSRTSLKGLLRHLASKPEEVSQYLRQYKGPLINYQNFLQPFLASLGDLSPKPRTTPIPVYLLLDDANFLNMTQTEIVNTWLSYREKRNVYIKISSPQPFKTNKTSRGGHIYNIHDYTEIDIGVTYAQADHKNYEKRLRKIIEKRFERHKIEGAQYKSEGMQYKFFPANDIQRKKLKTICAELLSESESDRKKVLSRAQAILVQELKSSYEYAGFKVMAQVSSGIIRDFLKMALQMFRWRRLNRQQLFIPTHIQNEYIKKMSSEFLNKEIELLQGKEEQSRENYRAMKCLIMAIGRSCHRRLHGPIKEEEDREFTKEYRVLSIAFEDVPSERLQTVLNLAVENGYLFKTTIATKDGWGSMPRYTLSRKAAPEFGLVPSNYSHYIQTTADRLADALDDDKCPLELTEEDPKQMKFDIQS